MAVYKQMNQNDIITYIILTDEPATNTGCDDGPHVKLAKVSLGTLPNDIAAFHDGCWVSDGTKNVSVIALPKGDFKGGQGEFYTTDFDKTEAFKTWYYEADGTPPVSLRR